MSAEPPRDWLNCFCFGCIGFSAVVIVMWILLFVDSCCVVPIAE